MFEILRQSLRTGIVTASYPQSPADVSVQARGRPEINWPQWHDARPAAAIYPTAAIECVDEQAGHTGCRTLTLDLGRCIFRGLCAGVDSAIRMTGACELAADSREALRHQVRYRLNDDGSHNHLLEAPANGATLEDAGSRLHTNMQSLLGRSLHIREVDAGSTA